MAYRVQVIPAQSSVTVTEEVLYYLLMQVPRGRLTRRGDMEQYLADRFGVHHVLVDRSIGHYLRQGTALTNYVYQIADQVPMHREVTARGCIVHSPDQIRKLTQEGFVILEPSRASCSPRVKDYKKYLFEFQKETEIPLQTLLEVNKTGLAGFLK